MKTRLYLSSPLHIEGWEIVERLESYHQYSELYGRIDDALALIAKAQTHWAAHRGEEGEWSEEAVYLTSEIRLRSYNIRQAIMLTQDHESGLASVIRSRVGITGNESISDAQCVAGLAAGLACRAIEALWSWFDEAAEHWSQSDPELIEALSEEDQEALDQLEQESRMETIELELNTRERVADLLGTARHYLTLADVYASPISQEAKAEIIGYALETKAREISRAGGKGNSRPDSVTQQAAAKTRERIRQAAERKIKIQPDISRKDLVSVLLAQGIASRPTIKKHLDALGILIEEN